VAAKITPLLQMPERLLAGHLLGRGVIACHDRLPSAPRSSTGVAVQMVTRTPSRQCGRPRLAEALCPVRQRA
jgi:hypothetical protein